MFKLTELKRLREFRGLSQEALASAAELSASTVQKHEQGQLGTASVPVAGALAKALDVPMEALFSPEITAAIVNEEVAPA